VEPLINMPIETPYAHNVRLQPTCASVTKGFYGGMLVLVSSFSQLGFSKFLDGFLAKLAEPQ